ncbi:MAG: ATP-binding protein [Polyangiaceae bacterium]|nr:ATP-binding protein [Polyangiaceae bacterium]
MARAVTSKAETHLVEWKESWRDEYLRWLCGFANADGGTLIIGKNDKGEPVGVRDAQRLLVDLPNKIRDSLGLIVPVRAVIKKGKALVEIDVGASPTPISYRGEYHFRSGSTKQQLTGNALSAFLLRKLGRHWDGAPVPGIAVKDLSSAAFRQFKEYAKESERLPPKALTLPRSELVQRLRLTEAGMLKRAALLLFHEDPERWFTGAYVKVGMFRSESDLAYHDEVHGDLFTQVERTVELLLTKYMVAWISYRGLRRRETFPIPREALREALLNALIHKDYGSGVPIQIRVYRDRLWIWNPGVLPETWTAMTLLGPHVSMPPNPDIAGTFFRAGLIEAWGRGYEKIRDACLEAGASEPTVEYDGSGVWLRWAWQGGAAQAEINTSPPTLSESELESELGSQLGSQLESRVLAALLNGPMGKAAIAAALGQRQPSGPLHATIRKLTGDGTLALTLPDKPTSRFQRYRLTPAGRARLAAVTREAK